MIKLADTLAPMADFPAVEAKDVAFNDNKSLQEKYDNGELGGGSGSGEENKIDSISINGSPITPDENKNVDITVPDAYDDTALVQRISDIESDYAKSSDIPSLSGYATETWVNEQGFLTQHQDLSNYATKDEIPSLNGYATEDYVTEQISNIPSVDLTDYAKKNEIPDVSGYITEEQLLAKDYADKAYVTEEIAKASTGGEIDLSAYLSKVEATETYVTKESGKSLIADTEIERLASVDNYDDTEIDNRIRAIEDDYIKNTDLAAVAKSGSYNDLIDTPSIPSIEGLAKTEDIPTKVSELENDSNYLSSIPEEYVTDTELEAKGYLTEHQDISNLVEKEDGKGLSSNDYTTEEKNKLAGLENYNDTALSNRVKTVEDEVPNLATKTYVGEQIANAEHLKREIVTVLPSDEEASDNIIYMLKVESATGNDKYQEYMKIDGTLQMVGDTSVDLTDYAKTVDIPTTVAELTDSADYAKKTDIPTTLPANGGNADTVNNHTVKSDVPENAVFTDTVYDDTDIKAEIAKKADATSTPHIDETTKNWFIGDVDTGILAEGTNGTDGTTYTPNIGTVTTVSSVEEATANVELDNENKLATFNFNIPKGVGVKKVEFTSSTLGDVAGIASATDTYTITFTDESTTTYEVYNGKDCDVQIDDVNDPSETSVWSSKKTSDKIAKVESELKEIVDNKLTEYDDNGLVDITNSVTINESVLGSATVQAYRKGYMVYICIIGDYLGSPIMSTQRIIANLPEKYRPSYVLTTNSVAYSSKTTDIHCSRLVLSTSGTIDIGETNMTTNDSVRFGFTYIV